MSQAIFGLVGVVVGAVVTGGMSLYLEWVRDRASARGAARILQGELMDAEVKIEHSLARGVRWPSQHPLRTDLWAESQPLMARRLRKHQWYAVNHAFDFLQGINEFDNLYRSDDGLEQHALDEQGVVQLELGRRLAVAGRVHLDDVAKWRHGLGRLRSGPSDSERTAARAAQEMLAHVDESVRQNLFRGDATVDPIDAQGDDR